MKKWGQERDKKRVWMETEEKKPSRQGNKENLKTEGPKRDGRKRKASNGRDKENTISKENIKKRLDISIVGMTC